MKFIELKIDRLIHEGWGMGTHEGKSVMVRHVAPGDIVRVKIVQDHKQYWEAKVVEVLTPSRNRVVPKCPIYYECGGCQLQHMDYAAQILWKQMIVEDQLKRIGHFKDPNILPTVPAPDPWHYRTRITLHCDRHGKIGFYGEGTHDAIEFEECPIASPEINARLASEKKKIAGRPGHYEVRLDDTTGFTQVHPAQNRSLQTLLVEGLKERALNAVVELFCGDGNFTFGITPLVGKVYGCDTHEGSIEQAIARAKKQGVRNTRFEAMGAQRFLKILQQEGIKPDGLILDPPRRGASDIVPLVLEMGPSWICYISCNPATLARDLKLLAQGGYTLESCQPVDMFPQTYHIETISWLSR